VCLFQLLINCANTTIITKIIAITIIIVQQQKSRKKGKSKQEIKVVFENNNDGENGWPLLLLETTITFN